MASSPEELIKCRALELGFDCAGIAAAAPSEHQEYLKRWLSAGMHAGMSYMAARQEARLDVRLYLPGAASVVMVGVSCNVTLESEPVAVARFARYALNRDYHKWILSRLRTLGRELTAIVGTSCAWKPFCDTSAVLERELAQRAGLGWIGKNCMLINRKLGSHLLLGGLITDYRLTPNAPGVGTCGKCRRCMDACPTNAIVAERTLDARLCIAYHTIESREPIPASIAGHMQNRVFGCDICQEVCPFNNARTPTARHPAFLPRPATLGRSLAELAVLPDAQFDAQFAGSAVRRAGAAGLRRNARAALANAAKDEGDGP
jgi:epoxyqueuosine reductase